MQSLILAFLCGGVVGGVTVWVSTRWWDWRTPSAERAFQRAWRCAKRMRMRADELKDVWSVVDLKGDRMLPIIRAIRHEELTLEASTEVIDRLRQRLLDREGSSAGLSEYRHGWRRSIVGNKGYPDLDKATRIPGVVQVGDHATPEAATEEARAAGVQAERVAGEVLQRQAEDEAKAIVRASATTT